MQIKSTIFLFWGVAHGSLAIECVFEFVWTFGTSGSSHLDGWSMNTSGHKDNFHCDMTIKTPTGSL